LVLAGSPLKLIPELTAGGGMSNIFWIAVLMSALVMLTLGGLWYGPLFGKAWRQAERRAPGAKPAGHPATIYSSAFLCALIAAMIFGYIFSPIGSPLAGLQLGLIIGAGLAGTSFGINYLFAGRSMILLLIDVGYLVVWFALMGFIFGFVPAPLSGA
jgi:hypothetical protein